jgi:hypothetical protein
VRTRRAAGDSESCWAPSRPAAVRSKVASMR